MIHQDLTFVTCQVLPLGLYRELQRVRRDATVVVPPLWDLSAAVDLFEHKSP